MSRRLGGRLGGSGGGREGGRERTGDRDRLQHLTGAPWGAAEGDRERERHIWRESEAEPSEGDEQCSKEERVPPLALLLLLLLLPPPPPPPQLEACVWPAEQMCVSAECVRLYEMLAPGCAHVNTLTEPPPAAVAKEKTAKPSEEKEEEREGEGARGRGGGSDSSLMWEFDSCSSLECRSDRQTFCPSVFLCLRFKSYMCGIICCRSRDTDTSHLPTAEDQDQRDSMREGPIAAVLYFCDREGVIPQEAPRRH
ncbi:unnamed protein product [Pleuronectes platessa]|uniref:Uncharacterized protein n=1 Tax=Pleuronectes platessa TaxID=8262 RepID=A0A9N7YHZ0_PLEPL|nr:unnamed protein product [Pleuronectes platessa]